MAKKPSLEEIFGDSVATPIRQDVGQRPPLEDIFSETGLSRLQQATTDPNAISYQQRVMQAPQQVEQMISQRPDTWQTLQKEIEFQQTQPRGVFKDPMTPLVTGLKTMGIPFQRAEAGLAAPIVAAQQGRFADAPRDAYDALMGRRNVELGDVARLAGVPDPYAGAIGLASTAFLSNKLFSFRAPKILKTVTKQVDDTLARFGRKKALGLVRYFTGMKEKSAEFIIKEGGDKVFLNKYLPKEKWQLRFLDKIRGGIEKIKNPSVKTWAEKTFGFSRKYSPKIVDPKIPYKETLKVQEGLKVLFTKAVKEYGDDMNLIIDDVAKQFPDGKIPFEKLSSTLSGILKKNGLIDDAGELSMLFKNPTAIQVELVNQNKELLKLSRGAGGIGIKDYVKVRQGLFKKLTSGAKTGKTAFNSDDHMIMELVNELDDVIPENVSDDLNAMRLKYKNWREVFNPANDIFKPYRGKYYTKSGENVFNSYDDLDMGTKTLLDDLDNLMPNEYKFSKNLSDYVTEKNIQTIISEVPIPGAQAKLTDYWSLSDDEHRFLQAIDDSLDEGNKFLDDFKRWSATQETLVIHGKQGPRPHPTHIFGELSKAGTRQFLKHKGEVQKIVGPMIPPSILRQVSGRNEMTQ